MPIVKGVGDKESTVVYLGLGDVHIVHGLKVDPLSRMPRLDESLVMFVEFNPADLKNPDFKMPEPGVSLVFDTVEMLDKFMESLQVYKQQYLKHLATATQNVAQA